MDEASYSSCYRKLKPQKKLDRMLVIPKMTNIRFARIT
jgi:hypothetical protein